MGKKPGTLVFGDIVQNLRKRGLSRRWAVEMLNGVLDAMKDGLKRGEEVELPFGTLKRVRQPRKPLRGWYLNRITTPYKTQFTVNLVDEKEIEKPKTEWELIRMHQEQIEFHRKQIAELRARILEKLQRKTGKPK